MKAYTLGAGRYCLGVTDQLKHLAPVLLPRQFEQRAERFYDIQGTLWCQIAPVR